MNPAVTYNLKDFIAEGSAVEITHYKTSILEKIGDVEYPVYNILNDYIDELDDLSVIIKFTDEEYRKYQFEPKILAYDVYGYTEYFFIIMIINNICNIKDFDFRKIKLLKPADLVNVVNRIINAETNYISANRIKLKEE